MKESLLTTLKNRTTEMVEFKRASNMLAEIIATEIATEILEEPVSIHTPQKEIVGKEIAEDIILVPILRAGVALLPPFMHFFEYARIGFIGIQRDPKANPQLYYEKIPLIKEKDRIILLDPMIATGGSTILSLEKLVKQGANPDRVIIVGMLGSPEGVEAIHKEFPSVEVNLACIDEGLDDHKYIVPGLGDFSDRYFGC